MGLPAVSPGGNAFAVAQEELPKTGSRPMSKQQARKEGQLLKRIQPPGCHRALTA